MQKPSLPEKQPILEVQRLSKEYKTTIAVNDLSLAIPEGVCFGLLGPNGAGKTTAIEIMEDIIEPTSGQIFYRGKLRTPTFREEVGIQFQHTALLNYLNVKETLMVFSSLFREPEDLDTLINRYQLEPLLKSMNNNLSGGQRQRLLLALAMINRPKLIFLDEPSTGLDPQARHNLWSIVEEIKAEGKTLILTTHSMEEAEHLCDRVAIMDKGKIIAEGSPKELVSIHCGKNSLFLPADFDEEILKSLPYTWYREETHLRIDGEDSHEMIARLTSMNADLSGMSIGAANLEDVFLRLTGRQLRD